MPPKKPKSVKISSKTSLGKTKGHPVQVHGEIIENKIKEIYGVSADDIIVYTATHDIPKRYNKREPGRNVSIKTTGNATVCFGDANRLFQALKRDSPLDVVVVKYSQSGDTKNIKQVERYNFNTVGMNLFGKDSHTIEHELRELHTMLQRGAPASDIKALKTSLQQTITKSGGVFTLNPKKANLDKGRSGRLQASISGKNWNKLIREHPTFLVATEECSVFGCPIPKSIQSVRRTFNKTSAKGIKHKNKNKTRKIFTSSKTMRLAKKILDTI